MLVSTLIVGVVLRWLLCEAGRRAEAPGAPGMPESMCGAGGCRGLVTAFQPSSKMVVPYMSDYQVAMGLEDPKWALEGVCRDYVPPGNTGICSDYIKYKAPW